MEAFNAITFIYQSFQSIFTIGSIAVANHVLQAYFFSATISSLVAMVLGFVQFAYASVVAESLLMQLAGLVMMWYLKIWDHYSGLLFIVSVFSMAIVSVYVYDCCGNISERFDNWRLNNRDWAVISSFSLMFTSTAYIFYSIHKDSQHPLKYEYSGIYLLMVLIVLIGNMLRKRSVIYTLMGVLTMNYLIGSRYYFSTTLSKEFLGLTALPYFMMALQAEKKERDQIKAETYSSFFKACISMAAFSLLNDGAFPLELTIGGVFILGIIINR